MKIILYILASVFVLYSCNSKKNIVNPNDYKKYLNGNHVTVKKEQISDDLFFWDKKISQHPENFVYQLKAASAHLKLFRLKGEIKSLKDADSLMKQASSLLKNKDPEILYSLSQNAITQHRFILAAGYNSAGLEENGDPYINRLIGFDVDMELGNFKKAFWALHSLKKDNSFNYLIRKAKKEDHEGKLDHAIQLMEEAFEQVENKNGGLACWALSNLGDMYGHAGRINDAYNAYLEVLKKDPTYLYALKGIAWIAYSHDKNTTEAKRILQYILTQANMPEIWLTLAEIEEWEGNTDNKQQYINRFIEIANDSEYATMYNKYLIQIFAEEKTETAKALALAHLEIKNRATPETYHWLAWSYFKCGNTKKAFALSTNYVYQKTFEPEALYHTALIFSANNKRKEAKEMLEECLTGSFELGPMVTSEIKKQLKILSD